MQPLFQDQQRENGQDDLPSPALGLTDQPVQKLRPCPPEKRWSPLRTTGNHVKGATHSHAERSPDSVAVLGKGASINNLYECLVFR